MKKLIERTKLIVVLALVTMLSNSSFAQTKFGVTTGVNFSKLILKDFENDVKTELSPGFQVGVTADIPVVSNITLQPAVLYVQKGFHDKNGKYGYAPDFRVTAEYLELPLQLVFRPMFANRKLLIGAGTYFAYGIGGDWKSTTDAAIGDIVIGNKGKVIFHKDGFEGGDLESYNYGRPFDYGLSAMVGYEFIKQLSVQVLGSCGLKNLQPNYGDYHPEGKLKNVGFGITLGYKF